MNTAQEQANWAFFKQGDKEAFAVLFRDYYKLLVQYGRRINPDIEVVEDCIQELFLELWQSRERIASPESVKGYLFKVLKTKIFRVYAHSQQFTDIADGAEGLQEFSYEALLVAEQGNSEAKQKLEDALLGLSNRQREALYLKFYNRLSYEEMSEVMGVNYQTVRNLVHQSIKRLRSQLTLTSVATVAGWLSISGLLGLAIWLLLEL
ncbi:MAG: sigma-70 family RNA polymerase sigma factor [Cytophagia bacterium]|nr:MAG: sigma-70 family RNA polymerase sigma factor [Cytophagales bacterium]TAG39660.1 MAG: sigma-70 family RNA polymerase sigma factor [Cytophagia bacterium]TAG74904.1 MAG: sigma-70 family RNA polymerase sigma factor [Runella slithyformis]TAG81266.1 MAG: sigma-70 family RNA polymerase sigma factor [Cytophagales bacterium]